MGHLIQFEESAIAQLRERLGAAEEAKQDLLAFARGHSGAVQSIHAAVLAAMDAPGLDPLLNVVTRDWRAILGLDCVSLAMIVDDRGFCCSAGRVLEVDTAFLSPVIAMVDGVTMRTVDHGHPLFGREAHMIRAEALVRLDAGPQAPIGLLLLGQSAVTHLDSRHGSELLLFLGRSLAAIIRGWLTRP